MNITLPRAVIEQAVEALCHARSRLEHAAAEEDCDGAIEALRTALEQQYMTNAAGELEPVTVVQTGVGVEKPEPVGWLYPEGLVALKAGKCWTAYGTKQDDDNNIPIYDAPLKRKPLSDDEIQALWEKAFDSGSSPRDFARAIEAAHSQQDDYELLGYVELGGYFGVEQARKNGLSGVPVAIYVEPLLPEPNNDLTQMVPIYIKPEKEKPTT